jgi:hypothetical protein
MKRSFLGVSFLLSVSFFIFSAHLVYAHFPSTDGDMTVTLHVDPNDDPTAGKQAHLYFLFDDSTKKFALANCTCTVSITELDKQTNAYQLSALKNSKPSIWGASLPYVFTERNVYHIVLKGVPKKANAFQPFTVSWYFRVDTINPGLVQTQQGPSDIVVLVSALVVVVIGFGAFFWFFLRKGLTNT